MSTSVSPLDYDVRDYRLALQAMSEAETCAPGNLTSGRCHNLAEVLGQRTGISANRWITLVESFQGVPVDQYLKEVLPLKIAGWMPALSRGLSVCKFESPEFARLPHRAEILNIGPSPGFDRWYFGFKIIGGPAVKETMAVSVSENMAKHLTYTVAGIRTVSAFPRPRPYDCHRMHVAVGIQLNNGVWQLRKIFPSSKLKTFNRTRMKRYAGKCLLQPSVQCFDCGRAESECANGRHANPLVIGPCEICRQEKHVNRKGVCVKCQTMYMKTGTLSIPV